MPSVDYEALRTIVSLDMVLDLMDWAYSSREPTGRRGWCPIHSKVAHKSRSFCVTRDGLWYCHVCEQGGDYLKLWALYSGQGLFDAAHDLCERLHLAVPYQPRARGRRRTRGREGEV